MTIILSQNTRKLISAITAVVGGVFVLIALAIRSDFIQRGCHDIPSSEWIYTASCTDAYRLGLFAACVAFVSLAAMSWMLWRSRYV